MDRQFKNFLHSDSSNKLNTNTNDSIHIKANKMLQALSEVFDKFEHLQTMRKNSITEWLTDKLRNLITKPNLFHGTGWN